MKHILIGNGTNIQYGGSTYLNTSIIDRAMDNARNGHYENAMKKTITPSELYRFFVLMRKTLKEIIDGKYDRYAFTEDERTALQDFHKRYPHSNININININIKHIGFEDYFLAMRLICNKNHENNNTAYAAKIAMQRLFLDSIYNYGRLNAVHCSFPTKFVSFLDGYGTIFTVNYDTNIESATGRNVEHLHGQFDALEEVYDPNSFRNLLPDRPSNKFNIPDEYRHTYCNAVMDFTKDFKITIGSHANLALQKLMIADTGNDKLRDDIESWKDSPDIPLRNLYYGYKAKLRNPALEFREYPFSRIDEISGQMHFLGLSPNNDTHILKHIKENNNIETIRYYYYSKIEQQAIEKYFSDRKVECLDVRDLWSSFAE